MMYLRTPAHVFQTALVPIRGWQHFLLLLLLLLLLQER